jgi:hypothetical protein
MLARSLTLLSLNQELQHSLDDISAYMEGMLFANKYARPTSLVMRGVLATVL